MILHSSFITICHNKRCQNISHRKSEINKIVILWKTNLLLLKKNKNKRCFTNILLKYLGLLRFENRDASRHILSYVIWGLKHPDRFTISFSNNSKDIYINCMYINFFDSRDYTQLHYSLELNTSTKPKYIFLWTMVVSCTRARLRRQGV